MNYEIKIDLECYIWIWNVAQLIIINLTHYFRERNILACLHKPYSTLNCIYWYVPVDTVQWLALDLTYAHGTLFQQTF